MSKVELVRQALRELGEASSQEVATFIQQQHGIRMDARFIPVVRASILRLEMLEKTRQAARAAAQPVENPDSTSKAIAAPSGEQLRRKQESHPR